MKVTVRELLRELLAKCDLDAEVKFYYKFADELDNDGKEIEFFGMRYQDDGSFKVDLVEFL
jgi:hypothetical protein